MTPQLIVMGRPDRSVGYALGSLHCQGKGSVGGGEFVASFWQGKPHRQGDNANTSIAHFLSVFPRFPVPCGSAIARLEPASIVLAIVTSRAGESPRHHNIHSTARRHPAAGLNCLMPSVLHSKSMMSLVSAQPVL